MAVRLPEISNFEGKLVQKTDADYDQLRRCYNAMHDAHPAAIAYCANVADVQRAIAYAKEHSLEIAVRNGGHHVAGYSVWNDALTIDLSLMKSIEVRPDERLAIADAGLTWGEFDAATQKHNLAVTGGRVTHTGVTGLLLGSGSGWLERKYGFTADSLVWLELVTASGELVKCSEQENADLFWAMQGAGPNFGVVTKMCLRLHPVGPLVYAGSLMYHADNGEVMRMYRDFVRTASDDFGGAVIGLTVPPIPIMPAELQGKPCVMIFVMHLGEKEKAEEDIRRLVTIPPVANTIGWIPYLQAQTVVDASSPPGLRQYWKHNAINDMNDEACTLWTKVATSLSSPMAVCVLETKGGAIKRVSEDAKAIGGRNAEYVSFLLTAWADPQEDEKHIQATRSAYDSLSKYTNTIAMPNFVTEPGSDRIRQIFGPEKYARLVEVKNKYDPQNLFHLNANILPTVGLKN